MKPAKSRSITDADLEAAARLKAIWQAMPKPERPTQQQLADAWDGPGDANQSLISQYMNGQIALNYRAVNFFARALKCDPFEIRSDLPDQHYDKLMRPSPVDWSKPRQPGQASHSQRPDFQMISGAVMVLQIYLEIRGEDHSLVSDPVLLAAAYEVVAEGGVVIDESNVIDATRRFTRKIQNKGVDDGNEQRAAAGTGGHHGGQG